MDTLALRIKEKAISLGYTNCGIIRVAAVAGYADRLAERMSRVRWGWLQFWPFKKLAYPQKRYGWAKSIIVVLNDNTVYNIPEALNGVIAKDYLLDGRMDARSDAWNRRVSFEKFLGELSIRSEADLKYGITALRFAAQQAGLGINRKNNFFYTENGSSVSIGAWLIDHELELIGTIALEECSEHCGKCLDACPTKALSAPFTTSLFNCVSFLTSLSAEIPMGIMGIPSAKLRDQFGGRVYGCDTCQDVCPFNQGKWKGGQDFPGLDELVDKLLPEKIMEMDYTEINRVLGPKFWYVSPRNAWKWKINALTAMKNQYSDNYRKSILLGLRDENRRVRKFTKSICKELCILA